jgi:hypothetical protein
MTADDRGRRRRMSAADVSPWPGNELDRMKTEVRAVGKRVRRARRLARRLLLKRAES